MFKTYALVVSLAGCFVGLAAIKPRLSNECGVGAKCSDHANCKANMTCMFSRCRCNPGYIGFVGAQSCMKAFNPGDGPCETDPQCEAGWPGATCNKVTGLCQCAPGAHQIDTQDGRICVHQPDGATLATAVCPLPEGFVGDFLGAMQNTVAPAALPPITKFACTLGSVTAATGCNNVLASAAAMGNQDELYDCIPFTSAGVTRAAAQGICCPSRAFTCIQPKRATKGGVDLLTRFWYNSITNLCESFKWSHTEKLSNSNNFRTEDHCLSYCRGTARRGPPKLKVRPAPTVPIQRIIPCLVDTDCPTATTVTFTCNSTANPAHCLPTKASSCSNTGGRVYITMPAKFDEGLYASGIEADSIGNPRYYWDGKRCAQFTYLGQGGNFNNFFSESDCMKYCS